MKITGTCPFRPSGWDTWNTVRRHYHEIIPSSQLTMMSLRNVNRKVGSRWRIIPAAMPLGPDDFLNLRECRPRASSSVVKVPQRPARAPPHSEHGGLGDGFPLLLGQAVDPWCSDLAGDPGVRFDRRPLSSHFPW